MQVYDCHVHTIFSRDGKATAEAQCEKGKSLKISGITLTDHSYPAPKGFSHGENIRAACETVKKLQEVYDGKMKVFCGVELADLFLDGCDNAPFYAIKDIDFVLGSVHSAAVVRKFFPDSGIVSLVGNGGNISLDFARRFTERYLLEVLKTAEEGDVDAIAHMTYPLRYINGEGKKGLCISTFCGITDAIFEAMIKRDLALEVNTSGYGRGWAECMPPETLLKRYFALGGRKITLGSDAHKTEQLAAGFSEAISMLQSIGFTHAYFYERRKAVAYAFGA